MSQDQKNELASYMPNKRQVARFALAPQLNLSWQGVGWGIGVIIHSIACLLASVGLLEKAHPALNMNQVGQIRLTTLLKESAGRLEWKLAALPQWIMFGSVCGFLVATLAAVLMVLGKFLLGVAFANNMPGADLGTEIINQIFDVNMDGTGSSPIEYILGSMLRIYSTAMLVLAGIILLYLLFKVMLDTLQSGVPFGKNFNSVWVPIRLVVAMLLLLPITSAGLNGGQVVILQFAEWGSNVATKAFHHMVGVGGTGTSTSALDEWAENASQLASVNAIGAEPYFHNLMKMELCRAATNISRQMANGTMPTTRAQIDQTWMPVKEEPANAGYIQQYNLTNGTNINMGNATGDWRVSRRYYPSPSGAQNNCGETVLVEYNGAGRPASGAAHILDADAQLYREIQPQIEAFAQEVMLQLALQTGQGSNGLDPRYLNIKTLPALQINGQAVTAQYNDMLSNFLDQRAAIRQEAANVHKHFMRSTLNQDIENQGWVAAAIWMNTMARLNAEFIGSASSTPSAEAQRNATAGAVLVGNITEGVLRMGQQAVISTNPLAAVTYNTGNAVAGAIGGEGGQQFFQNAVNPGAWVAGSIADHNANQLMPQYMENFNSVLSNSTNVSSANNAQMVAALFELFFNKDSKNPLGDVHSFGRSIFDAGMGLLVTGMGGQVATGLLGLVPVVGGALAGAGQAVFGLFVMIGSILIMLGFVAGFLLPMMPMIRFVIGIGGWLLLIFEAVLAMPLIALAHLRTDGEGLPGQMARNAYIMALSLFLRPFMMVAGLFVGLIICNAVLGLVNQIFVPTVVGTAAQSEMGIAAAMAYLIIYVIIAFTLVNSAFKAIDVLPNEVMRWIGSNLTADVGDSQEAFSESKSNFAAVMRVNMGSPVVRKFGGGGANETPSGSIGAGGSRGGGGGGGGGRT